MLCAPALAEFALKFSSFEYFWLVLLGLSCLTRSMELSGQAATLFLVRRRGTGAGGN